MIRDELLALAEELDGVSFKENCDQCLACGTALCRADLECAESAHKACAKRLREIVECDECEDTTVIAYELLSNEDREALAWVREYGGLEAVRASIHQGAMEHGCLLKVAEMLGTSIYDGTGNADALLDKLEKRLMPAGCEWPRFEDGEPVRLGDIVVLPEGGEPREVYCINHFKDCWYIGPVGASSERLKRGDHVKRPENPVLAADGEPLEVGQTVYGTRDLEPVEIVSLRSKEYDGIHTVKCKDRTGFVFYAPDDLTHQRPVLDADGVPIKVGDEVWSTRGSESGTVVYAYLPGDDGQPSVKVGATWHHAVDLTHRAPAVAADGKPLREGEMVYWLEKPLPHRVVKTGGVLPLDIDPECTVEIEPKGHAETHLWVTPDSLSHERPQTDTWELLEQEAKVSAAGYCSRYGLDVERNAFGQAKAADLVRRCRALAERERGE